MRKPWLPWRYRWLISAGKLPWVPDAFAETLKHVVAQAEPTEASLIARREALARLRDAIAARLCAEGFAADPAEAFAASHPELGYAHNLDAWKEAHRQFLTERGGAGRGGSGEDGRGSTPVLA